MNKIYDRLSVIHDKDSNKDKLLLFYRNKLVATIDLKPAIEELLYIKGWTKK